MKATEALEEIRKTREEIARSATLILGSWLISILSDRKRSLWGKAGKAQCRKTVRGLGGNAGVD